MNQDQLREVTAAIQHELELARAGDGYEEKAVAEEIVDKLVAPLLAERDAEAQRLRQRIHKAVDETQRRYAKYQSRCASFDTWSKWAREHAERMGDNFWQLTSNVHRLYVMSLHEEIERLRREVDFEANGAVPVLNGLSLPVCACLPDGTELPAGWSLPQCSVHPDRGGD